jgi:hypothetical protein
VTLEDMIHGSLAAVTSAAFEEAKAWHPGLAKYATPEAAMWVLRDLTREPDAENLEVTRAFLIGFQNGQQRLFGPLLLGAFQRMLHKLRCELWWAPLDREDLDQLIVTSFLSAASEVKPRRAAGMVITRLRQRTRRLVIVAASRALEYENRRAFGRGYHKPVSDNPNDDATDIEVWDLALRQEGQGPVPDEMWRRMRAEQLMGALDGEVTPTTRRVLELLGAIPDTTVAGYVDRTSSGDDQHKRRRYLCLKKREERAKKELRRIFGEEESSIDEGSSRVA